MLKRCGKCFNSKPSDFVIATGETRPLESFVETTFATLGLDWHAHVKIDNQLLRPTDLMISRADPSRAADVLGWRATHHMSDVVRDMVNAVQEGSHG